MNIHKLHSLPLLSFFAVIPLKAPSLSATVSYTSCRLVNNCCFGERKTSVTSQGWHMEAHPEPRGKRLSLERPQPTIRVSPLGSDHFTPPTLSLHLNPAVVPYLTSIFLLFIYISLSFFSLLFFNLLLSSSWTYNWPRLSKHLHFILIVLPPIHPTFYLSPLPPWQ